MLRIAINCDKCKKEITDNISYDISITKTDCMDTIDDMEDDTAWATLCESCYSKFYINFYEYLGGNNV